MKDITLKLFIIFLFFFGITGCSGVTQNEETEEFPPSIPGFVEINETEYKMESGGFRWERKKLFGTEVVTTDAASPNQIAENFQAIPASKNAPIKIEIQDSPKLGVFLWNESSREGEVIIKGNEFKAPENNGKYIYEVMAEWPMGEISYTFVIEVK